MGRRVSQESSCINAVLTVSKSLKAYLILRPSTMANLKVVELVHVGVLVMLVALGVAKRQPRHIMVEFLGFSELYDS